MTFTEPKKKSILKYVCGWKKSNTTLSKRNKIGDLPWQEARYNSMS